MATKAEVQKRRLALKQLVTQRVRTGEFVPGQILPPVRELAKQHQLSLSVVNQAMQELADEGLLYILPRVGTFVGQPQGHSTEIYLLIMPGPLTLDSGLDVQIGRIEREAREAVDRIQLGFEERITQLGGTSLVMTAQQAIGHHSRGEMPPLAGVFNYDYHFARSENWHADGVHPHVGFTSWAEDREHYDLVSFDDVDGGRQATSCLMGLGHRKIAYLAMHAANEEPGMLLWSVEREAGWRDAMTASCLSPEGLAFHPDSRWLVDYCLDYDGQYNLGQRTARSLISRPDITAVVAANDATAFGLIAALQTARIPVERWPAIIGFDNAMGVSQYLVTSLSLPWDEVGRTAADILWQRTHAKLTGPPVHRRVPMRMIRRISSQAGWSVVSHAITVGAIEPVTVGDQGAGDAT